MLKASADPHKRAATNSAADTIISAKARRFKPLARESGAFCQAGAGLMAKQRAEGLLPRPHVLVT
jgi:hypothetical protein